MRRRALLGVLFFVTTALAVQEASADTTLCTEITSLPTTITAQGIYCLTRDFSLNLKLAGEVAITIRANNVVFDLNGHKIGNLSAGKGTQAIGIDAIQVRNTTIRNGTIRGFQLGIRFNAGAPDTPSQGHVVEDIHADQNTFYGIHVRGRNSLVRRNLVTQTGGTTDFGGNADGAGIIVLGPNHRVIDNDVITVTKAGTGTAWGIFFIGSGGGVPDNGIAVNNRVTDADIGIVMQDSSVKYRDNLTTGAGTPYSGGTDAGNNH